MGLVRKDTLTAEFFGELFELPDGVVYLDGAGRSPLLRECRLVLGEKMWPQSRYAAPTQEALSPPLEEEGALSEGCKVGTRRRLAGEEAIRSKSLPWTMKEDPALEYRVRANFRKIIGADSVDSIAITPSTSYAMSTAAQNVDMKEDQVVIVLEQQMASNVYPWQALCQRTGGTLLVIPRPRDFDWTSAVLRAILENHGKVAAVALPQCHWTDGSKLDLELIGQRCTGMHIPLMLDLTQSVGMMRMDVQKVQPAFLCASVHKWLLGPYGFSLMYVAPKYREQGRPLEHFERNRRGAADPAWDTKGAMTLAGYPEEYEAGAARFNGGGRPNPVGLPMLDIALQSVLKWYKPDVIARLGFLTGMIAKHGKKLGLKVPPTRAPHIIGLRWLPAISEKTPEQFQAYLKQQQVYVSVRCGAVRVSVGIYVTLDMVEYFCAQMSAFFEERPPGLGFGAGNAEDEAADVAAQLEELASASEPVPASPPSPPTLKSSQSTPGKKMAVKQSFTPPPKVRGIVIKSAASAAAPAKIIYASSPSTLAELEREKEAASRRDMERAAVKEAGIRERAMRQEAEAAAKAKAERLARVRQAIRQGARKAAAARALSRLADFKARSEAVAATTKAAATADTTPAAKEATAAATPPGSKCFSPMAKPAMWERCAWLAGKSVTPPATPAPRRSAPKEEDEEECTTLKEGFEMLEEFEEPEPVEYHDLPTLAAAPSPAPTPKPTDSLSKSLAKELAHEAKAKVDYCSDGVAARARATADAIKARRAEREAAAAEAAAAEAAAAEAVAAAAAAAEAKCLSPRLKAPPSMKVMVPEPEQTAPCSTMPPTSPPPAEVKKGPNAQVYVNSPLSPASDSQIFDVELGKVGSSPAPMPMSSRGRPTATISPRSTMLAGSPRSSSGGLQEQTASRVRAMIQRPGAPDAGPIVFDKTVVAPAPKKARAALPGSKFVGLTLHGVKSAASKLAPKPKPPNAAAAAAAAQTAPPQHKVEQMKHGWLIVLGAFIAAKALDLVGAETTSDGYPKIRRAKPRPAPVFKTSEQPSFEDLAHNPAHEASAGQVAVKRLTTTGPFKEVRPLKSVEEMRWDVVMQEQPLRKVG